MCQKMPILRAFLNINNEISYIRYNKYMNNKYGFNNIKQVYLSLLPAQIFANLTNTLSSIVNGLIIGYALSNLDMIALGFVSPILQIVLIFSIVVSSGARIICGKYIGRGDNKKINETFTTAVKFLVIMGALITVIGLTLSIPIAKLISTAEVVDRTALYIRGLAIGMIPQFLIPCLIVFLQMRNENTYALLSAIVLAVLNLALCLLTMSFTTLDIFDIGLITSISQFITLGFIIFRFYKVKTLPRFEKSSNKLLKDILVLGLPTALSSTLYAFRNTTLLKIADASYGIGAVNALSILGSSAGPFDSVNIGVASTTLMLASVYIGEKDKDSLVTLAKVSIVVGVVLALGKVGIIYLFADKIATAFGATPGAVTKMTVDLYRAYSWCMPLNMIALAFINTYQAFSKITFCNVILLFTTTIFPLTFAYFAKGLIGINSIWYCYPWAELCILIFIYVAACIRKKHLVTSIADVLIIDNQLNVGKHINITINSMKEVIAVSKKVQDYCLKEKIDKQRAYIAGLCLEEIAANIVEHGFPKSKRNNMIDIFVDVNRGNVNMRIKDNAVSFDPHIKINDEDPTKNIGIKMVSKLAKDMNYQNDFGLNVLSITL